MAQYKVPQDVEAEDKLLGPFTFRQFIYLIVTVGSIALAYALFQVFPLLAIIPIPIVIFFGALALPLKKDQPMETYLAAIVSFYLKPRKRYWIPGEEESTIEITAPKKIEKPRARNITEEEAGHRLSFLADLIDTEGQSIRNVDSPVKDEYIAEANTIPDVLDSNSNANINQMITREDDQRRAEAIEQLRQAMNRNTNLQQDPAPARQRTITPPTPTLPSVAPPPPESNAPAPAGQIFAGQPQPTPAPQPAPPPAPKTKLITDSPVVFQPTLGQNNRPATKQPKQQPLQPAPSATKQAALKNLANNQDYSIETLAKEAKRLESKDDKEVYVSLH